MDVYPVSFSRACASRYTRFGIGAVAWRGEVVNGPSYVGDLNTYEIVAGNERHKVATLRPEDPAAGALLPDLYEPALLGVAPLAMRLRGIERLVRGNHTYAVIQEWHCEKP
jgi:hypothetical protein